MAESHLLQNIRANLSFRYDFEYEEDEDDESGDVDIENKYYNAKQLKLTDPSDAIGEFLGIPPLEEEKGEWGFKGLKQAIKLEFKLGKYDEVRWFSSGILCFFHIANASLGSGPFCRASHLRQISRHEELFRKIH